MRKKNSPQLPSQGLTRISGLPKYTQSFAGIVVGAGLEPAL